MSRVGSILLLLLFGAFVGAPAVAWALGVKGGGTALQNRTLAKRPPLTFAKVWDASFGKELSDWVWDTIPLRDKALTMNHEIDWYGFHDSPSRDAVIGRDGFTWRRERIMDGIRAGGGEVKDVQRALDKIEAAFKDAGVPLYIVLSPTKGSIYPEYMKDAYRAEFDRLSRPVENYYRQRAKTDPSIIDLWGPMLTEKKRLLDPNTQVPRPEMRFLWRKNDDHWNVEAGRIQAREIVRKIDPALWDEAKAPTLDGKFSMNEAEISILYLKLDIREPYQGLKPSPLVSVKWERKNIPGSHNSVAVSTTMTTPEHTPRHETILVIRDSMLSDHSGAPAVTRDGGFQTVAPFFDKVVFMHWETWQTTRKKLKDYLRGIDRVVVQVTQGSNYYLWKRASELVEMASAIREANGETDATAPVLGPLPEPPLFIGPLTEADAKRK